MLRWVALGALGLMLIVTGLKQAHLGIRHVIASQPPVAMVLNTFRDVEISLDIEPPTTPTGLTAGRAPIVLEARSYINRAALTKHVMAPFDSTGGDLLVAYASSHGKLTFTPSDNFGNTWIPLAGPTDFGNGDDLRSALWYAKDPKTGPNYVYTMDLSEPRSLVISLFVIRGSDRLDPVDAASVIASDVGAPTITVRSPVIMTRRPDSLMIGFAKTAFSEEWQAGGGFAFQPSGSSDYLAAETGLASAPAAILATFEISGLTDWQSALVAVKPDTASGPGPITLSWQPSNDNVDVLDYVIERCMGSDCEQFVPIGTSIDTSFVDRAALRVGRYRYRVRAVDAAGNRSQASNIASVPGGGPASDGPTEVRSMEE